MNSVRHLHLGYGRMLWLSVLYVCVFVSFTLIFTVGVVKAGDDTLGTTAYREAKSQGKDQLSASGVDQESSTNVLNHFQTWTIHGSYVAAGVGMRNLGYGTIALSIPSGSSVEAAYLYWDVLGSSSESSLGQGQLDGHPITGDLIGQGPSPCWGTAANYAYRAEVTSLVTGSGSYALTGFRSGKTDGSDPWLAGSPAPMAEGASLVVVYSNPSMPLTQVHLYDGSFETEGAMGMLTISGFTLGETVGSVQTTFIGADGQRNAREIITFNGSTLPIVWDGKDPLSGPVAQYVNGNLWDTMTVDVSNLVHPGATSATVSVQGISDCLVWVAQVFSVPQTSHVALCAWEFWCTGQSAPFRRPDGSLIDDSVEIASRISQHCRDEAWCDNATDDAGSLLEGHDYELSWDETQVLFEAAQMETGIPARLLKSLSYSEGLGNIYPDRMPRQFLGEVKPVDNREAAEALQTDYGLPPFDSLNPAYKILVTMGDDSQTSKAKGENTYGFGLLAITVSKDFVPVALACSLGSPACKPLAANPPSQSLKLPEGFAVVHGGSNFQSWTQEEIEAWRSTRRQCGRADDSMFENRIQTTVIVDVMATIRDPYYNVCKAAELLQMKRFNFVNDKRGVGARLGLRFDLDPKDCAVNRSVKALFLGKIDIAAPTSDFDWALLGGTYQTINNGYQLCPNDPENPAQPWQSIFLGMLSPGITPSDIFDPPDGVTSYYTSFTDMNLHIMDKIYDSRALCVLTDDPSFRSRLADPGDRLVFQRLFSNGIRWHDDPGQVVNYIFSMDASCNVGLFGGFDSPLAQAVDQLIQDVNGLGLPQTQMDTLLYYLNQAKDRINRGDESLGDAQKARERLAEFTVEVENQVAGGHLTPSQGQSLIEAANGVSAQIPSR